MLHNYWIPAYAGMTGFLPLSSNPEFTLNYIGIIGPTIKCLTLLPGLKEMKIKSLIASLLD
jgi:hypothetical protein